MMGGWVSGHSAIVSSGAIFGFIDARRLGRIIRFPSISDECANLIHDFYGARNQEQAIDALAVVGYLIWTPPVMLAGWIPRRLRQRHRRQP